MQLGKILVEETLLVELNFCERDLNRFFTITNFMSKSSYEFWTDLIGNGPSKIIRLIHEVYNSAAVNINCT